jgi:hypothetical protein
LADDARILVADVAQQLLPNRSVFQIQVCGQNQRRVHLTLVHIAQHRCQKLQHAARALKGGVGAPSPIERVDDQRVERVRQAHALAVGVLTRLFGHIGALIEVDEGVHDVVQLGGVNHFLHQSLAQHAEELVALHGGVKRLHAPEDLLQLVQGAFALGAVGRAAGQGRHQRGARRNAHRLRQLLTEHQHLVLKIFCAHK